MKITFKRWKCTIVVGVYLDNSKAIRLLDARDGMPIASATVSLAQYQIKPTDGNIFVKDYSENTGMINALIDGGVINPECIRTHKLEYVDVGEYALTEEGLALFPVTEEAE